MADLSKIKLNGTTYNLKDAAVPAWAKAVSAPVVSVNGNTGTITIDKIKTTAGDNNVEYNLIGTATNNTNTSIVNVYQPTLLNFSKYVNNFARLTIGSTSTPGVIRIYTNTSGASGYTDLEKKKIGDGKKLLNELPFIDLDFYSIDGTTLIINSEQIERGD